MYKYVGKVTKGVHVPIYTDICTQIPTLSTSFNTLTHNHALSLPFSHTHTPLQMSIPRSMSEKLKVLEIWPFRNFSGGLHSLSQNDIE